MQNESFSLGIDEMPLLREMIGEKEREEREERDREPKIYYEKGKNKF